MRDAKVHVPNRWSGEKDSVGFAEFLSPAKNWAGALHDDGMEMLELVEGRKTPIDESKLDRRLYLDVQYNPETKTLVNTNISQFSILFTL